MTTQSRDRGSRKAGDPELAKLNQELLCATWEKGWPREEDILEVVIGDLVLGLARPARA
jgi:hypothetical protein